MKDLVHLLFEAHILKKIPRSGYHFLGAGKESVAEHCYIVAFIGFIFSMIVPEADAKKLTSMCLLHDLPEARTGDLNYVQKRYVTANEEKAMKDAYSMLPFGNALLDLQAEYNDGTTLEAKLAHDADQIALMLDLKSLSDIGYKTPPTWYPNVRERIKTKIGKEISDNIMNTNWDSWWFNNCIDRKE
jgi:putative hydrolase of HD superfamily